MPLYDFRCQTCGATYQEWSSYAERDQVKCPHCGSTEKEMVFKANYTHVPSAGADSGCGCGPAGSGFT
ncbi:zinc ribbon domain-containing protein [Bacillaceae bacterium]